MLHRWNQEFFHLKNQYRPCRLNRELKVGLNLKFDYKMQFLFLEKSETSGIEESHDMSF